MDMFYNARKMREYLKRRSKDEAVCDRYIEALEQLNYKSEHLSRFKTRPVELVDCIYGELGKNATTRDLEILVGLINYSPCLITHKQSAPFNGIRRICKGIKERKICYLETDSGFQVTTPEGIVQAIDAEEIIIPQGDMALSDWVPIHYGYIALQMLIDPKYGLVMTPGGVVQFYGTYRDWLNSARYGI